MIRLSSIVDFIWPLGLTLAILALLGVSVWRVIQEEREKNKKMSELFADLFETVPEQTVMENIRRPDGGTSGSLESEAGSASAVVLEAPDGLYVRFAWDASYFLVRWCQVEEASLQGKKGLALWAKQQDGGLVKMRVPWDPSMRLDGWLAHSSARK